MSHNQPATHFGDHRFVALLLMSVLGHPYADAATAQELQTAQLGECFLESGESIVNCSVGYRTVGELAVDRNNVVLLTTWGNGTSGQMLAFSAGAEGFVDPGIHFVVAVDAFGNGVASSPSNSPEQPGDAFPVFTFRDVVRAQHRLLTEVLGIDRLHAVIGISSGGFQALEWATTYPLFTNKVVSVMGSPQPSPHDLMVYTLFDSILTGCEPDRCDKARETYLAALRLVLQTPQSRARTLARADVAEFLGAVPPDLPAAGDIRSQTRAALLMDVSQQFGGSLERAAAAVEAEMLLIVATNDLISTPEPSREFARLTGARLYETSSDCGHQAFVCESAEIGTLIRAFLR